MELLCDSIRSVALEPAEPGTNRLIVKVEYIIEKATMIIDNLKATIDESVVASLADNYYTLCSPAVITKHAIYAFLSLSLSYHGELTIQQWTADPNLTTIKFQIENNEWISVAVIQDPIPKEDVIIHIRSFSNDTERSFVIRKAVFDELTEPAQNLRKLRELWQEFSNFFQPFLLKLEENPTRKPKARNPHVFA